MTTNRDRDPGRHPFAPFRKDNPDMFHIEFRVAEAEERISRFRAEVERERFGVFRRRRFRHRIGRTIVRVGELVHGDALSESLTDVASPA
jgi:hypothetical protein